MKITRARISCSERALPNAGMPASVRPSRIDRARLASSPPWIQTSSTRLAAWPPWSFAPWHAAQVSAKTCDTSRFLGRLRRAEPIADRQDAGRQGRDTLPPVLNVTPSRKGSGLESCWGRQGTIKT